MHYTFTPEQVEKFWSSVDKSGECWLWTKGRISSGYGEFCTNRGTYYAHRVSYALAKGDPGKLFVMHSCDNPPCVNPDHLSIGTCRDNSFDAWDKGRLPHPPIMLGEKNPWSKITEAQVREIRTLREGGMILRLIAERYGLSIATTQKIATRQAWTHVP